MLERLFSGPVAVALSERLASVSAGGWIAAVDVVTLVHKIEVQAPLIVVERRAKALRKVRLPALVAAPDALPFAPRALAALICPLPPSRESLLQASSVVADGGLVIAVGVGDAREAATTMLSTGLMDLQQRRVGRTVICSGVVASFE